MPNPSGYTSLACALLLFACAQARGDSADAIGASYPEGPLYVGETLYYAEAGADRVIRVDGDASDVFYRARGCAPTAIAPYGDGFLILCHRGARVVAVNADGREQRAWTRDANGRALQDPNDATADGAGGVYFSDPGEFTRRSVPHGHLAHLSADGVLRTLASNLWYPNGVYFDASARALYVSEHMAARIWRYAIGADGELGARTLFADLAAAGLPAPRYDTPYPETGPDGLEIGPNGDLYAAQYGAGRILRFSPAGALRAVIDTPARYVTNIAFAPDGSAAVTGPFENLDPPFRGEVRFFPAARLTRAPD